MVEGARLESEYTPKRIEGSNPSLSAMVQDGGVAVPCNLQSAIAESKIVQRAFVVGGYYSILMLIHWTYLQRLRSPNLVRSGMKQRYAFLACDK